jgi:hypothetical protein
MVTSLRRYAASTPLSALDRSALAVLLGPLLRLRQGCCHPQAVDPCIVIIEKSHDILAKLANLGFGKFLL